MESKRDTMPVNVAARELGFSRRWIEKLIQRGDLTAENPGQRQTRVFREAVEAFKKKDVP
ncbi:MAG: helix-turn-helix domain-containing protein [Deltaproteobacteria bacterium]|nr:helix-turn-helix domain-containing protein [Deltaproteobacteria bacterium]